MEGKGEERNGATEGEGDGVLGDLPRPLVPRRGERNERADRTPSFPLLHAPPFVAFALRQQTADMRRGFSSLLGEVRPSSSVSQVMQAAPSSGSPCRVQGA